MYTNHQVLISFRTSRPGTILALSLCNIHGLWQSTKNIAIY
ncbi:MAG: desulfoferrodoxin family protein [Candidatus Kariarchaeaceae archaeon]